MAKLDDLRQRIRREADAAVPWCIDKRIRWNDVKTGNGYVVDVHGNVPCDYRELLQKEGAFRDYTPQGDAEGHPAAIMVLHPAALSAMDASGAIVVLAKTFGRDIHVMQSGSRWWWVFIDEPDGDPYNKHDGRCWYVVRPNGTTKLLAAS